MSKARDIASAAPAPSTVSATEIGYLDGVTSAIQTQLDAKTAKSTLTTTGDIYYASAANTPARLGIGSTSDVLTVVAGVPGWAAPAGGAGNMVQIATGTLSGASVVISGLSSYTDILVFMFNTTNNTAAANTYLRLNATSSNHTTRGLGYATGYEPINISNDSDFYLSNRSVLRTNSNNSFAIKLTNCKNPGFTDVDIVTQYEDHLAGAPAFTVTKGIYTVSEAVSSITLRNSGGTWAGGTYIVWGA
jgi:hypothetical protein